MRRSRGKVKTQKKTHKIKTSTARSNISHSHRVVAQEQSSDKWEISTHLLRLRVILPFLCRWWLYYHHRLVFVGEISLVSLLIKTFYNISTHSVTLMRLLISFFLAYISLSFSVLGSVFLMKLEEFRKARRKVTTQHAFTLSINDFSSQS